MAGFMALMDRIFDPIFAPLLGIGPLFTVIIISLIISILMTYIYKWTTDQKLMKELKEKMKSFQQQVKENRTNPEKAMAIQKEAMQVNMQYMMQSLRPTLFTFIPIIIIFTWLSSNLAYVPIAPNTEFTTTMNFKDSITGNAAIEVPDGIIVVSEKTPEIKENKAQFRLKGQEGNYIINYKYNEKPYSKDLLIDEKEYDTPLEYIRNDQYVESISIDHLPLKFDFKFFKLGWIWIYIIVSVIASLSLRKALKIY